jgi:nucleotide-binding universal stress UspA family protein
MPKRILLPATGDAADPPVFATALTAARLFDGHMTALHVRPDPRRDLAALAAGDIGLTTGLDATLARMEADADSRERTAEAAWRDFCEGNGVILAESPGPAGVTCEFVCEIGAEGDWIAEHGRVADLIVAGRGRKDGILLMDVIEAALMDTGKPVLLASDPPPASLSRTVAIAWKNTREAGRAVAAALPFIRRATRVIVFTVEEQSESQDRSHLRLVRSLRWHTPEVSARVLQRNGHSPVEVLLDAVGKAGCDLLVMGGYGHTRLREAVFGGFTRAVLEQAPLPVLMAH